VRDVQIDGVLFTIPAQSDWKMEVRPGGWWVGESPDGRRRRWKAKQIQSDRFVSCGGYTWKAASVRQSVAKEQDLSDEMVASLPGRIRKVWVQSGQEVAEGDPLVLLEAMKMEFRIQAPRAGKVDAVFVQEGQCVELGEVLLKWCSFL
jgi:biotin carboxyl carrier protein